MDHTWSRIAHLQQAATMRRTVVQPDPQASESTAQTLESLECETFLKEYKEAYAKLRDDPAALAEFEAERRAFDGTLMDGLEDEVV